MAAIATMTVRLTAQIAEFQSEFRTATKSAEQFASSFEGIATRASAVGTFLGNIATKIASSIAGAFGTAIRDAVRLSSEFNNAFIGLGSVARAFGTDADAAGAAAKRLSSDGLLPLKDSATGLKNLLATGFNLDQSVQLMNAFKDSAAFGRAGALSFGDAIRTATEGVKNGNSILVDNAGITKNLSQILKEAGFSAQDLSRASSDAGVRMALFNGILKEAAAFTGDAQRATETYSGQIARLDTSYNNLLATLGDAITQNATVARTIGAISDAIAGLNTLLVNNRNGFNLVSEAVIFLVRAFASTVNAIDLIQTGFHGLQIASNRLFEGFSNIGIAIFKMVEKASLLQKFLDPVNFQRHAAAADEARQAYETLEAVSHNLRQASADAQARSISFGNALQTVKAGADALAKELESTRGKTVELGSAANVTGRALGDSLASGAAKGSGALKSLSASITDSLRGLKSGLTFIPGFKVDISKLIPIPALPDFGEFRVGFIRGMQGALDDLPGIKVDISDLLPPPPPPTFFQKYFGGLSGTALTAINAVADAFERGFDSISELMSNFAKQFATDVVGTLLSYVPVIGSGLQRLARPLIDWTVDFFNNLFRDTQHEKVNDLRDAFFAQFGPAGLGPESGFHTLARRLHELGAAGDAMFKRLTNAKRVEDFNAVVKDITEALDEFGTEAERAQRRLDALGVAVDGVNRKAALFAAPFEKLSEAIKNASGSELDSLTQKMQAMAQAGQAEFERLGTFVAAAFAGLVKETGDALGAISQLAPAFQVLQRGVNEFGLTSTGTIDALLKMFGLVNDAVTGPILQSIQATGQIFAGLQDAGFMTADLFQTVASDIGASFRDLEAKGGDVAQAMALSQPVLQKLWEAQQIYGEITDETTRKLLKQAEEQGLVGAHMKDVKQKILDVLIAIADVFGAVLPDSIRIMSEQSQRSFREMRDAARQTREDLKDAFSDIRVDPVVVPIEYDDPGFTPKSGSLRIDTDGIPQLAAGGIVRRPTLALVGEAGPEAVIPLSRIGSIGPADAGMTTAILEVDGRAIAEAVFPHLPGVVRRHGLV